MAGFLYWGTARVPSGGRDHGLPWAQLILDSFEAVENYPLHAKTSAYQISVCGVAAHKSFKKEWQLQGAGDTNGDMGEDMREDEQEEKG